VDDPAYVRFDRVSRSLFYGVRKLLPLAFIVCITIPFLLKYRSRTDIIEMILRASMQGSTKTRIMYGAYLSYAQVKEYLSFLTEKGLISCEEGTGLYRPTPKGMDLLRTFDDIGEMMSVTARSVRVGAAPDF
jgi:predicted transcriptional regulator